MKKATCSLILLLVLCVTHIWAQGPNNSGTYYKDADGKKGQALKTALSKIINPHTNIGYDGLYEAYKKTDTRSDGYVRDWYSKTTKYRHVNDKAGSYKKEGDCYNREHSVPQSWFGSGVIISDIVHVLPTDGYVNNRRSNLPFGEVNNVSYSSNGGYCKTGSCKTDGYNSTVFEPGDDIKGDLARIYFYMATCYESQAASWGHDVFTGSSYQPFSTWTYNMLVRWAKQDPVDEVEIARNNAVYETQENRNPFVDYPGLEDYVWGNKKEKAFSYDNYEGNGNGTDVTIVAMPVIAPDEGTYYDSVAVTVTCVTDSAVIYYTLNGDDASELSTKYDGPFVLTESATVKAVAIKGGKSSVQAIASYSIENSETPVDGEITLGSELFNVAGGGTINSSTSEDFIGTDNGITLNYALGNGQQRYVTQSEIRLYTGNTLTVSVNQDEMVEIEFTVGKKTGKLNSSVGINNTYKWIGKTDKVVFTSEATVSLTSVKVKLANNSAGIDCTDMSLGGRRVVYNLRGQRVAHPVKGVYIVDGRKVVIR